MFDYEEAHYVYLTSWWKKGLIDKSEEKTRQSKKELLLCCLLCKKMYQLYQKRIGIWRFEVVLGKLDFETFFFMILHTSSKVCQFSQLFFFPHQTWNYKTLFIIGIIHVPSASHVFIIIFSKFQKLSHWSYWSQTFENEVIVLTKNIFLVSRNLFPVCTIISRFIKLFSSVVINSDWKRVCRKKKVKLKGHKCLPKAKRKAN